MLIPYFHIDSFTKKVFAGNPAGVCVLESWLDDATLLGIAAENGLAETAFIVGGNGVYGIRWFTPDIEMDLCGHATLAAAHVVANYLDKVKEIKFKYATDELNVQIEDGLITMMFPRASRSQPFLLNGYLTRSISDQKRFSSRGTLYSYMTRKMT
ncbi:MAG TPA: PhzF family phenazine biosynthesis protein [Desulfuromonadales bacterium]|nr:PhzF family phenazine biosynthesis protein [Desulfuromonadales bacterium]